MQYTEVTNLTGSIPVLYTDPSASISLTTSSQLMVRSPTGVVDQ